MHLQRHNLEKKNALGMNAIGRKYRKMMKVLTSLEIKPLILLLILLLFLHFCHYTTREKKDVYETWWVWERADESAVKSIKPIEWGKIADNSKVMGLIDFKNAKSRLGATHPTTIENKDQKSFAKKTSKLSRKTKTEINAAVTNINTSSQSKLIVVLEKKRRFSEISVNETLCGACKWSFRKEDISDANAVVIEDDYLRSHKILARRSPKQIFIWFSSKSPYSSVLEGFTSQWFSTFDGIFNMTMTCRRDSDIYFPYFTSYDFHQYFNHYFEENNLHKLIGMKSKLVYWRPQQCGNTKVSRMAFDIAYRLRVSGLHLDVYGKCWEGRWSRSEKQYPKYKFYLALGNEWHCPDFLSMDIWKNAFLVGAVPIIWGPRRQDVNSLLPRNSFLFLEDFASAFELTNYLEYLHNDDAAYLEYLEWRQKPFADLFPQHLIKYQTHYGYCQLCSKLHQIDLNEILEAPSLHKWWVSSNSQYCVKPQSPNSDWFEALWWRREYIVLKVDYYFPFVLGLSVYLCVFSLILFLYVLYRYVGKTPQVQQLFLRISNSTVFKNILKFRIIRKAMHIRDRICSKLCSGLRKQS